MIPISKDASAGETEALGVIEYSRWPSQTRGGTAMVPAPALLPSIKALRHATMSQPVVLAVPLGCRSPWERFAAIAYGSTIVLAAGFSLIPLEWDTVVCPHFQWRKSVVASQQPLPLLPRRHGVRASHSFSHWRMKRKSKGAPPLLRTPVNSRANAGVKGWPVS
jgi:hypothetical protein